MLVGDWRETLPPEAPFDLLFFDATKHLKPWADAELAIGLLAPGGLAVLDDLTPAVRDVWLAHPALATTELLTTAGAATIVGVRR